MLGGGSKLAVGGRDYLVEQCYSSQSRSILVFEQVVWLHELVNVSPILYQFTPWQDDVYPFRWNPTSATD